MKFAKVHSAQPLLLGAQLVDVEVDISGGLYAFATVGLPDKAVEESRDRISSAIKNSGYKSPKSHNQKTVVSLAPADLKKEGPVFDCAIALAYLRATGDVVFDEARKMFLGELSLDGVVRPIRGTLACVREAQARGFSEIYVPKENAPEAALVEGIAVYPVKTLTQLIAHLEYGAKNTKENDDGMNVQLTEQPRTKITGAHESMPEQFLLDDIRGQETAKRGLSIAAAGGHNIVLYGPPGTGKTMLARAFTQLLPPLAYDDVLEVTAIHSSVRTLGENIVTHPPFRCPHHTASYVSLVGGGTIPKPGEVTLAHKGVLFLDEFPEFDRRVIDALRQPLEDRTVSISRAKGSAEFPARFILIAAMNPCPCGKWNTDKPCTCPPSARERYQRKISGPIVDRIDMWIDVPHVPHDTLTEEGYTSGGEGKRMQRAILDARVRQVERFQHTDFALNSDMPVRDIDEHCGLSAAARDVLTKAAATLDLSPRSYHRTMKLARTIADMDGNDAVEESHVLEALQYRPKSLVD